LRRLSQEKDGTAIGMRKQAASHPEKRPLKTLERVLSKAGLGSRSEARGWIGAGRVRVNGRVEQNPDRWVDLERDKVTFDGKPVRGRERIYILLYKPAGYVTTRKDPDGRATVYDLIRDVGAWVAPVGRLDLETSGLLILTNDTQFSERLTNPAYKATKTYQVKAADLLSDEQLERLRQGVELSDGPTRPAEVKRLRDTGRHTHLEMTITEGRNRQVRRMLEAVGSKVLKLVRTAIGPIRIGDLAIGKWRLLTAEELRKLAAGDGVPAEIVFGDAARTALQLPAARRVGKQAQNLGRHGRSR
jgi:pseudouridine synthase